MNLKQNDLKKFAKEKYGKNASKKLATEISETKKITPQTVRNWFSGRNIPVSKDYYLAIQRIWPKENPHSFFMFKEFKNM